MEIWNKILGIKRQIFIVKTSQFTINQSINQSKFVFWAIEILLYTVYASAQKAAREAYAH